MRRTLIALIGLVAVLLDPSRAAQAAEFCVTTPLVLHRGDDAFVESRSFVSYLGASSCTNFYTDYGAVFAQRTYCPEDPCPQANWYIAQFFVRFDTSAVPVNSILISAALSFRTSNTRSLDDLRVEIDYYASPPPTFSCADYVRTPVEITAASASLNDDIVQYAPNTINFTNLDGIVKGGTTVLRGGLEIRAGNAAPTESNYYTILTDPSGAPPALTICYEATGLTPTPTVTPTVTPTPTDTPTPTATPTPTVTQTPCGPPNTCGNCVFEPGEDCDPPGSQCPNAATGILCSGTCQCACPSTIEFTATSTDGVLDTGWTGVAHDATVMSDGTITVDVATCEGASRPCGVCSFTGPIANTGAADYGAGTGTQINNQRCTGNVRVTCGAGGEQPTCTTAGGTCEFYFGTLLPLAAGGVSTCVENRFNGSFTGTANLETGTSTSSPRLTSRVFGGATNPNPCPRCIGDPTPNDGVRGGTCSGGTDDGQVCDVDGSSPNPHFGSTSLDCRPSTSVLATLPIDLTNTTGTATKTLTAANPNCRATGFTSLKCFCDTCASLAAEPCASNADCPGGRICGGRRCRSGSNVGGVCTVAGVNSQCPGGSCGQPGVATAPNQCDDATCYPTTGNSGECSAGPTDFYCSPNGTMIPCSSQTDCDAAGLRSCNGGPNVNKVCTTDAECPGGSSCATNNAGDPNAGCCLDLCTLAITRPCYTDNGIVGASVNASGNPDVPVNDASAPTLAALVCIGPTSTSSVNGAAGLPGLGRLELMVHMQATP
jgi:hypothetical protein